MNSGKLVGVLAVLFALAFVVTLGIALNLRRESGELNQRLAAAREAASGQEIGDGAPTGLGEMRDSLSRKDATIRQLQQQIKTMQASSPARDTGARRVGPLAAQPAHNLSAPAETPEPDTAPADTDVIMPADPLRGSIEEQEKYFSGMDISSMNAGQAAIHQGLVKQFDKVINLLDQAGTESDTARSQSLNREISREFAVLNAILRQERVVLLQLTAADLGYDESGGRLFVDNMDYVNEMTSSAGTFRRLRAYISQRTSR